MIMTARRALVLLGVLAIGCQAREDVQPGNPQNAPASAKVVPRPAKPALPQPPVEPFSTSWKVYKRFQWTNGDVYQVAFSPDGKLLAACGGTDAAGEVKAWSMPAGRLETSLTGPRVCLDKLSFSPDGKNLAASGISTVHDIIETYVWNLDKSSQRASFPGEGDGYGPPAFSPDGKVFITTGTSRGFRDVESLEGV
jgi:WD40 repeat protein